MNLPNFEPERASEGELKTVFQMWMDRHFNFQSEVEGVHLLEKKKVYADFLLTPKQHLLDAGFEDMTIVVEVKSMWGDNDKLMRATWQAATYVQSTFNGVRPRLGVVFPNPIDIWGGRKFDTPEWDMQRGFLRFLQFANVGYFEETRDGWQLKSGTEAYFTFDRKKGLKRSPHNILRRCVGNF